MITCLSELYFRFRKSYFYELWQHHKQLKTMEISEAWPDTYDDRYVYTSIPTWLHVKVPMSAHVYPGSGWLKLQIYITRVTDEL